MSTFIYIVRVTRFGSPENGLTESIEYIKSYKTERGALLHILDIFKGTQKRNGYIKDLPNGDQLFAELIPAYCYE